MAAWRRYRRTTELRDSFRTLEDGDEIIGSEPADALRQAAMRRAPKLRRRLFSQHMHDLDDLSHTASAHGMATRLEATGGVDRQIASLPLSVRMQRPPLLYLPERSRGLPCR